MTPEALKTLAIQLLTRNGSDRVDDQDILTVISEIIDQLGASKFEGLFNDWLSNQSYDIDHYSTFLNRIWKSKTNANLGNEPPSSTSVNENTHWVEVSSASSNPVNEWKPGLFGSGLIMVFWNDNLYKLTIGSRPFESVDIDTEITDGKWQLLFDGQFAKSSDVGDKTSLLTTDKTTLVAAINELQALIQAIGGVSAKATNIADRDTKKPALSDNQNIYVEDASADATVTTGWAIYKYLESLDDFIKIIEQESVDLDLSTKFGTEGGTKNMLAALILSYGDSTATFSEQLINFAYLNNALEVGLEGVKVKLGATEYFIIKNLKERNIEDDPRVLVAFPPTPENESSIGFRDLSVLPWKSKKRNKTVPGTSYEIIESDLNVLLFFTAATDVTISYHTDLTDGFNCELVQNGAGQIILPAATESDGKKSAKQKQAIGITKAGTNVWAFGNLTD